MRYELVPYKHDLVEFQSFKVRVMAQTVSHQPHRRGTKSIPGHSVWGVSWTKSRWDRLFPSTSGFCRLYRSNNAPYLSLSTSCSYQKDNQAKPGNLPGSLDFKGLKTVSIFY